MVPGCGRFVVFGEAGRQLRPWGFDEVALVMGEVWSGLEGGEAYSKESKRCDISHKS